MTARPGSRRTWAAVAIAAALVVLLLVFRPAFRSAPWPDEPGTEPPTPPPTAHVPDAVIAIKVDVEDTWRPIDVEPIPVPPQPEPAPDEPEPSEPRPSSTDETDGLDDLDLSGAAARVSGGATASRTIPPRPVEITWPETARLKQCIGRYLEVNILVGENGAVQRVESMDPTFPEPCLGSALTAARQIRFQPGTVDGRPATLWTRVRIDFEKRD